MKAYPTVTMCTAVYRNIFTSVAFIALALTIPFFGYSNTLVKEPADPVAPVAKTSIASNATGGTPVKLSAFHAIRKNADQVALYWSTSEEINTSHFIVERSTNGKDFADAGLVFAVGNSTENLNYRITVDLRNRKAPAMYYRLTIVDMDGKTTESEVFTLNK
ncbi:MAG: hypothetical protein ACTHMC_07205 [Pseudobacter sp.]|uniref:hypothetical protein n=1 Tax=Pseudobacter sp. TaxID=2045420 RepID=UPI003F813CA0